MYNDRSKPMIGVTMALAMEDHQPEIFPAYRFEFLKQQYYEEIENLEAVILPLPNSIHTSNSGYYIDLIDGLLLVGGEDVGPGLYGEKPSEKLQSVSPRRDNFEREMIIQAVTRKIPILGICRGHQIVNTAFGGSLYQDLSERREQTLDHRQTQQKDFSNKHKIQIEADSHLAKIIGRTEIEVNSGHHQVVRRIPEGLRAVARSDDGVIEALEGTDDNYILTVQWHPEVEPVDEFSHKLFEDFVREAVKYKGSK